MRTAPSDTADSLRIIAGSATSAGVTVTGTGFSITKLGTGSYVIHFTIPFRTVISYTASATNGGTTIPVLSLATNTQVQVVTFVSNTGTGTDGPFSFIVTGIGSL